MEINEEIIKLKALKAEGAITEEEYLNLVKKLETSITNQEAEGRDSKDSVLSISEQVNKNSLAIKNHEDRMSSSGQNLRNSANAQVWSVVFGVLYAISYFIAAFSNATDLLRGAKPDFTKYIICILFAIASFIFWIRSVIKLNEAGMILSFTTEKPPINYSAPKIISQLKTNVNSFFGENHEIIQIEYADGVKGTLFYWSSKKVYELFGKDSNHYYYRSFEDCINALHYFKTTGLMLPR